MLIKVIDFIPDIIIYFYYINSLKLKRFFL